MPSHSADEGGPPQETYQEVYPENGRWYGTFKKGKYMFPIDETELERLDVFHKIFLVARKDALFSAPVPEPETVKTLDVGCGTGIWSIHIKYPGGDHWGIDLNWIQPEYIPANVHFMQKDIEDKWQELEPGTWDLVHMRTLNGSISNWTRVYSEIFRHLKPHTGWFEQVEIDWSFRCDDGTLPENSYANQWADELLDAMDSFGRPMRMDSNLVKQRLRQAGFVDVKEEVIRLPVNRWVSDPHEKDIGRWFNLGLRQSLQPLALGPLFRNQQRTPAEVRDLVNKVKMELWPTTVHAYCTLHTFTARKPR
ncbi:hypothetical protein VTJ49DRAFT_5009 [Mycothermus thermophilus]|uniref:S-adenosyl-L-methionine-dependent methyltransferase n=1 Tax=Humicola insolens TaxID=85995 RepID=A0ABR3VLF2_HUMIN